MDGWMDGWIDGWMDAWMGVARTSRSLSLPDVINDRWAADDRDREGGSDEVFG